MVDPLEASFHRKLWAPKPVIDASLPRVFVHADVQAESINRGHSGKVFCKSIFGLYTRIPQIASHVKCFLTDPQFKAGGEHADRPPIREVVVVAQTEQRQRRLGGGSRVQLKG